jgi:pimeloyl-ACP methyl ester carboxylesterase
MPLVARTIAGVPTLIAEPVGVTTPCPVVFWHHGFTADALTHASELTSCAALGMLAVGVDAVGHGARRAADLRAQVARRGALPVMLDQVDETVAELTALRAGLLDAYDVDATRLSLVGISMGAFLVYRAIVAGVPARAAVALLGSPEWPQGTDQDHALVSLRRVALLSITAEHDVNVPPEPVTRLHAALAQGGSGDAPPAAGHAHHVLPGVGHLTPAAAWDEAMARTRDWLIRHG